MAKFSRWTDWQTMARDVSTKFSHITLNDFDAGEFRFAPYELEVSSTPTMPLGDRSGVTGVYFEIGEFIFVSVFGSVVIDASGVADSKIYFSLPFPYSAIREDFYRFRVTTRASINSDGAFSELLRNQWAAIWQEDGLGNVVNFTPGDTVEIGVSGVYQAA